MKESERVRLSKPMSSRVLCCVERIVALGLALILLRSAFAHLGNPYYFLSTVYSYQQTGIELGKGVAAILPFLQMTVAVCLLLRWWLGPAYLMAALMFTIFFGAQVLALRKGLDLSCGCFGAADSLHVGAKTLASTGAFGALSIIAWFLRPTQRSQRSDALHILHGGSHGRSAFTLMELVVVLAIIVVSMSLVLPAVQKARSAASTALCANRLKQIGVALHQYHDGHGFFPPGCSFQGGLDSQPHMSWLTRLLPFLEQMNLWQNAAAAFKQERFFETPPHFSILGRVMPEFVCPTDDRSQTSWNTGPFQVAFTDYLGVEGQNLRTRDGVLFLDSRTRIAEILDGASTTLIAGERPPSLGRTLGWWYAGWGQMQTGSAEYILGVREIRVAPKYGSCPPGPYSFRVPTFDDPCDMFYFWSFHPGGVNFAFCDGSVRFLAYSADPIMPALATRAGGEAVGVPE